MTKKSFSNFSDLITEQPVIKSGWQPLTIEKEEKPEKFVSSKGIKSLREVFEKDFDCNKNIEDVTVENSALLLEIPSLIENVNTEFEQIKNLQQKEPILEEVLDTPVFNELPKPKSVIEKAADHISKEAKLKEESYQQPNPQFIGKNFEDITRKVRYLEQWISKITMAGPGGGEVRLKFLDDVDRATIAENRHLAYNATTDTFFFEDVVSSGEVFGDDYTTEISAGNVISVINLPQGTPIGPIEQLSFNVSHTHEEARVPGTLCWDPSDNTLNLTHPNDVVQQVGQESYMIVRNRTGNTILNGQCMRFDGAEMNGTARMLAVPFLADGTYPSLYLVGVATSNIAANTDGFVTVTGKVRDIDTTGNVVGETWAAGDILYASPTSAGNFTKVKPTAPNNVVPVAAVLRVSATQGEIFVRPTIEQKQSYGRFARTTDVTVDTINTAANIIFDTTVISNGVTLGTPASKIIVDQSGYYGITVNAQIDVGGGFFNSGTMYMWLRKNGTDVPQSMIRQAVSSTAAATHIQKQFEISLDANDFIEIMYAGDDAELQFEAFGSTAFGPNTAAVFCTVTQLQL